MIGSHDGGDAKLDPCPARPAVISEEQRIHMDVGCWMMMMMMRVSEVMVSDMAFRGNIFP